MPPEQVLRVTGRAKMKQRFCSWCFAAAGGNMKAMNTPHTPDTAWAQAKTDALIKQCLIALSQRFLLLARCSK